MGQNTATESHATDDASDKSVMAASNGMAVAALVLACALWGGNFVVGRAIRGTIDPETLNLLRWIVAVVVFLPFRWPRLWNHRHVLWRHRVWVLGLTVTGVIGFQQATYTALTLSPVANAVLLLATTPLLIMASSAALGQGRLGMRQVCAVVLSLFGVAIILGEGDPMAILRLQLGAGDLWLLGAVALWTTYTQLLRRTPAGIPGDVSLLATMVTALPLLLVIDLIWGNSDLSAVPPLAWAGVAYVGLGAALMAFLAWGYGVARKGPDVAGLYINLIPVFAISLAWLALGERIVTGQMVGAAFVIAALVLGTVGTGKTKPRP